MTELHNEGQATSDDRQPLSESSLVGAFAQRARAVGAQVTPVVGIEEAARVIAGSEVPTASGLVTASSAVLAAFPELRAALQVAEVKLRIAEEVGGEGSPSDVALALAGEIGIVLATAGVAETGSFLSADTGLPARLLGMLADTVYALLPASSIVPSLDEMGVLLSQLSAEGNRYLSLVTGPSRTADIERVLTIGVQGPKALHVVILVGEQEKGTEASNG